MSKKQEQLSSSPCPICGGRSYAWGEVLAQSLSYKPQGSSVLSKMLSSGLTLPARHCDTCGNLQVFSAAALKDDMDGQG